MVLIEPYIIQDISIAYKTPVTEGLISSFDAFAAAGSRLTVVALCRRSTFLFNFYADRESQYCIDGLTLLTKLLIDSKVTNPFTFTVTFH